MGFKTNHKEATQGDFSIKPEGDYEVIIKGIEEKTTRNNKTGLNMKLLIRNDQVEGYSYGQIMNLSKAANLPDGKEYESLSEYCADLIDKCVRVTLKHEEYNGKMQERISYINETKFPDCKHVYKESQTVKSNGFASKPQEFSNTPVQSSYPSVDIDNDDDLPF